MSSNDRLRRTACALAVGVSVWALAACGGHESGATQTVAKVNDGEITVHQVNDVLQQQRGLRPDQMDAASRQVLEHLIDREVVYQQAVDQKVDREPAVVSAIEAAKRDIIARAYLEKVGATTTPPTPADVQKYFDAHPGLFSHRRIYTLQEVNVQATEAQLAQLRAELTAASGPADFMARMKAQNLPFTTGQATQPAEALPLALVDPLSKLSEGQAVVQPGPGGAKVLFVLSAQDAPVTLDQARPAIEQFITQQRRRDAADAEVKRLRTAAKVEYLGAFAKNAASAPAAAPAAAPASAANPDTGAADAGTANASSGATASAPAASPAGLDDATLKKGLGIK